LDWWNAITKIHEHEEGESKENCKNCAAERLIEDLTEFELFTLVWYRANINQFSFDAHLIGELIKELKLIKETKIIFLKIVDMIYQNDMKISQARARKDQGK